jgi:peroxiredoxin
MTAMTLAFLACSMPGLAADDQPTPPAIGDPLPRFELFDVDGRRVRSAEIAEPVIVLNFWAFWCDTWIKELPQLRELAAQQPRLGFRLFTVTIDGAWTDQLARVCGEQGAPFPVLVDRGSRLTNRLGLRRIPTVIVVNRERRITFVHEAYPGNPKILEAIRVAGSVENADE